MKKAISLLLLSLCLSVLHARDINFSQISSKNGLSQNTVRAIAEDKNGFIWAGTLDGLNRDMTVIISDLINCEPVISIYCMTIELEIYMPRVMVTFGYRPISRNTVVIIRLVISLFT